MATMRSEVLGASSPITNIASHRHNGISYVRAVIFTVALKHINDGNVTEILELGKLTGEIKVGLVIEW